MKNRELFEKIIEIIEKEDKKNPLTDEEIAEHISIARELITKVRKENNISNSRNRRIDEVKKQIIKIKKEQPNISNRELTRKLNNLGYNLGKYVASKISDELFAKKDKKVDESKKNEKNNSKNVFNNFIGYDRSLKNIIEQLKAAIMYPPKGLHTIIYGESGVGKSYLVKLAYKYALTTENFSKNSPFYEFNCADYAENPQLLLSQLFGYSKGAFTGAAENKKGIVELCNNGILFLDEIHRLPSEGQEILFTLIDNGVYRRLGEVDSARKSNLMIIAATTENPESSLLLTFRRRIPMSIKIPALNDRSIEEKIELIRYFLYEESMKLNKIIKLKKDVLKTFLEISYPGNIGQLKSDIQVCCAKAFLESKIGEKKELEIKKEFIIDILAREKIKYDIQNLKLNEEYKISPNQNNKWEKDLKELKLEDTDIYQEIEIKYDEMIKEGVKESKISKLLEEKLRKFFDNINKFDKKGFNYKELRQIIGAKLLDSIIKGYEFAKKEIPTLSSKIIFPLSIHLKSSIKRAEKGKNVDIPVSKNFEEINKKEIRISEKILEIINENSKFKLPKSEIIFITIFLNEFKKGF